MQAIPMEAAKEKIPAKKRRKIDKNVYKSNETITSDADEVEESGPLVKEKNPTKSKDPKPTVASKTESTAKSKKSDNKAIEPDEETIKKLKKLVNACGAKVNRKDLEGLTNRSIIKILDDQLDSLGMQRRRSMTAAKEIKAQRELAKEMSELEQVSIEPVRQRRTAATAALKSFGQAIEDEGQEARKDKRSKRNVDLFVASLKSLGEL